MTLFFTATYEEAAELIKHYRMKKLPEIKKRQVFKSEKEILVICGTGAINASVSVACAGQMFGIGEDDTIVAFGICASTGEYQPSDIVLCNKLVDLAAVRDLYPDILFKHPFKEGSLTSFAGKYDASSNKAELTDSEGAFIYQAAVYFVQNHNIHIIKIIEDYNQTDEDKRMQIESVTDWLKNLEEVKKNTGENAFGYGFQKAFSHIYVEEAAMNNSLTLSIINKYPDGKIITVKHYKDVFCKKEQNFIYQKKSPKLILAVNNDKRLHKGSDMCDNFGHENFFYCTHVMNCLYNCEYCYLQGMYASANIVIFVNIQDVLDEVEKLLETQNMYVCISYDGDLLMFEGLTGYVRRWMEFTANHKNLEIELRTKSAAFEMIKDIPVSDNVVLSWTLTPQEYINDFEQGAPTLKNRINAAACAAEHGWRVRICVDPMLYVDGCEEVYKKFFAHLNNFLVKHDRVDVSIGVFRAPVKYIRKMKKLHPDSKVLCYEFVKGTYSEKDRELLLGCAQNVNL